MRSPYNGNMMGPAWMTLTYVDVEFGDEYETPKLEVWTATDDQIRNLLRVLPNQLKCGLRTLTAPRTASTR